MPFLAEHHDCSGWHGEMAERIRAFDWSTTELGPIDRWQPSLGAAVRLLLASPVPMVLLWGRPGYMIYNDAYAVFAGGRHPYLLGCPVELGWPEVADFNRHVMQTCLAGGTLSFRDKELVLLRNGRPEDVWMDLYYSPVSNDDGAPAGVLAVVVETTERVLTERWRQEAESALQQANERLQLALNTGAVLGTWVWDIASDTLTGDERFARTFSVGLAQAIQGVPRTIINAVIHPDDIEELARLTDEAIRTGAPFRAEYRIRRAHDSYLWVQANGQCEFDSHGEPYRFPGVLIDIDERKLAEQALRQLTETLEKRVADAIAARALAEGQLRQAQKMEAIGNLTGGIAHDFNNVLQVISGNLQMLAAEAGDNPIAQGRIATAANAVRRGAKLASHLLAFARRQPLSPAVIHPGRLIGGMAEILHRALGESLKVETRTPDDLWNVKADRNQLENALLNLAINGRDAMRGGGTLTISAANVVLDGASSPDPDADTWTGNTPERPEGDYVVFRVADTGTGMTADVLEHAFEPFFTTKADGHGTGLGLSMVFGFVKQSGGHIAIQSTVGRGTTVQMFFPRCLEAETPETAEQEPAPVGGGETVLVVEDDPDVRITAVEMLAQLGYRVRIAPNGDAAWSLIDSGIGIDLLFTDVIMPGAIKGGELARRAAQRRPPIPVLFASGYTRDEIFHLGKLDDGVTLLNKPYRRDDLARAVRTVLDAHRRTSGPAPAQSPQVRRDGMAAAVLLVEDDVPSREALQEVLLGFGLDCAAAGSAEEALLLADDRRFDVLLTDITLPGMAGDALAVALRAQQPHIDVVLMTGYGAGADLQEPIAGARVLGKPIDLSTLRRELGPWMGDIEAVQ
ncbi:hybrid sensor histidine kinase/response regulator [Cupriavidus gilardii]|uniref:hybrid sensor histidine kinase/response regulator n=1 Tax=Cupriavidus gilardii TaxID=82541 RepID=UPI0007E30605|nr:response regulator [Cupriavidus gilardii]